MLDLIVSSEPRKVYDKRFTFIMKHQESTGTLLEFVSTEVEKAFTRGVQAGIVLNEEIDSSYSEDPQVDRDAVLLALRAGITEPDTLASLYAREQGFKP